MVVFSPYHNYDQSLLNEGSNHSTTSTATKQSTDCCSVVVVDVSSSFSSSKINNSKEQLIRKQFMYNMETNNDKYFLQHCLKFEWNTIMICCMVLKDIFNLDSATTSLLLSSKKKNNKNRNNTTTTTTIIDNYKNEKKYINSAKRQLLAIDKWGNNILHIVCSYQPPYKIIKAILDVLNLYPKEDYNTTTNTTTTTSYTNNNNRYYNDKIQLHLKRNFKNVTPLIIACSTDVCPNIIQDLLYPPQTNLMNGGSMILLSSLSTTLTTTTTTTTRAVLTPNNNSNNNNSGGATVIESRDVVVVAAPETYNRQPPPSASSSTNRNNIAKSYLTATTPFMALVEQYEMMQKLPYRKNKEIPLDDICSIPNHHLLGITTTTDSSSSSSSSSILFDTFWTKIVYLIEAAWFANTDSCTNVNNKNKNTNNTNKFISLLHGASYVCELFPPVLTRLFIRCYPEMVSFYYYDDHNNKSNNSSSNKGIILPLHLAVSVDTIRSISSSSSSSSSSSIQSSSSSLLLLQQRKYFIDQLLFIDPTTVHCRLPTTNRLPIYEAIVSGFYWYHYYYYPNTTTITERRISNNNNNNDNNNEEIVVVVEEGPLQSLWKCSPTTINEYDPITGLYPFMLAATIQYPNNINNDDNNNDNDNDRFQLDTIYSLLRLVPHQVK